MSLILRFVQRDLQSRYRGSFGGLLWTVLNPLILLALFTVVFSSILRIRLGPEAGTPYFAIFLFCGMLPWMAIQDGLTRSSHSLLENAPLIKRTVFPVALLPIFAPVTALVHQAVGTAVLLAALIVTRQGLSLALPFLLVLMAIQLLFTVGLGWALASLAVFFRDIGQFLSLALTLWVFLTPIFYPPSMIPEGLRFLLVANPLALFVGAYRDVLLLGALPSPGTVGALALFGGIMSLGGYTLFRRLEPAFADVL